MSNTTLSTLRSWFVFFSLLGLLVGPLSSRAQDVASVVENMREVYQQQLETVDTYIIETNMHTTYGRKVTREGAPAYETSTRMKGQSGAPFASNTTPSWFYGIEFDRFEQHATYEGTEMIDGSQTHILHIDNPTQVDEDMGEEAESMTYYIDAERHVPLRMIVEMQSDGSQQDPMQGGSVTTDLDNYQTVDGLTLPHRMEIKIDTKMSPEQRKQMKMLQQKMENMPEEQRKQMEQMMGDSMNMLQNIMSGEPIVMEVQNVQVNVDLPPEAFSNGNES